MKFTEITNFEDRCDVIAGAEFEDGAQILFSNDHDCESPRSWDNIGTMSLWHSRYDLPQEGDSSKPMLDDFNDWCEAGDGQGDVGKNISGREVVERLGVEWFMMYGDYYLDHCQNWDTAKWQDRLVRRALSYIHQNYAWSLVGMTDHSMCSFSHVGPYNYGDWDSGIVGCHYVSLAKLREEFPNMTDDQRTIKGYDHLAAEIETFDLWQAGSVVRYKLLSKDGELIDSCCGFITDKYSIEDLMREVADHLPNGYDVE